MVDTSNINQLLLQGKTIFEVANEVGVSPEIVRICGGRTLQAMGRIRGINGITNEEIEYVRANINDATYEEMGAWLGRTSISIRNMAHTNCIKRAERKASHSERLDKEKEIRAEARKERCGHENDSMGAYLGGWDWIQHEYKAYDPNQLNQIEDGNTLSD